LRELALLKVEDVMTRPTSSDTVRGGRWLLHQDQAAEFLQSSMGVLLHELGHHAAANDSAHVVGHLIIELSSDVASGAFSISDEITPKHATTEQLGFTIAAGALAELEFTGITLSQRLLPDVTASSTVLEPRKIIGAKVICAEPVRNLSA
jgi:hypothetical protein